MAGAGVARARGDVGMERLPTSRWLMGSPLFLRPSKHPVCCAGPRVSPLRSDMWDGTDFSGTAVHSRAPVRTRSVGKNVAHVVLVWCGSVVICASSACTLTRRWQVGTGEAAGQAVGEELQDAAWSIVAVDGRGRFLFQGRREDRAAAKWVGVQHVCGYPWAA